MVGVSFPSALDFVSSVASDGAWSASNPLSNILGLWDPRRRAIASAAGARQLQVTLSSAQPIRFVALVHHNAPAGTVMTAKAWSTGPNTGALLATATATIPAQVGTLPQVAPILFGAAVSAAGVTVDIPATGAALAVGGIEVSDWWDWSKMSISRTQGYQTTSVAADMSDGVDHVTRQWAPRILSGDLDVLDLSVLETTVIDFMAEKRTDRPFVYVREVSDPTTWPRECALVRLNTIPPGEANSVIAGKFPFDLIEQL